MFSIYRENLNSVRKKGKLNCNGKPGLYSDASGIRSYKYGIYYSTIYHTIRFKYPTCLHHKQFKYFQKKKKKHSTA